MSAPHEAAGIAALCDLFEGAPGAEEALALLSDPGEGGLPPALSVLAELYGHEAAEPTLAPGPGGF